MRIINIARAHLKFYSPYLKAFQDIVLKHPTYQVFPKYVEITSFEPNRSKRSCFLCQRVERQCPVLLCRDDRFSQQRSKIALGIFHCG